MATDTSNPNQNLIIPKWINEEYFVKVLEENVSDFDKILSFKPLPAIGPGENYTSLMVRVIIKTQLKDGNIKEVSFILKTALESAEQTMALVNAMNLFPKEKQMYQTILPAFLNLYKEAGEDVKIAPQCLFVDETPEKITLVMEDLKQKNFRNINRLEGFDLLHMRHVLRKLAELHAASTVFYELNGPYDNIYNTTFYNEDSRSLFEGMAESRKRIFLAAIREWNLENVDYYISKIPPFNENFNEAIRVNHHDPDEFNVLNHGDCWSNNIMFRYTENGDIKETLFIDFQVGKWGTPAQDLWYLITTSSSLEIKVKEFDHFIYIYHQHLAECLKTLKYSKRTPSLKDIHMMMIKYGSWATMTMNGPLVAILLPSDKDANMENMFKTGPEGEEFIYKTLINPYFVKAMHQLYPFLDNKGILDISCS